MSGISYFVSALSPQSWARLSWHTTVEQSGNSSIVGSRSAAASHLGCVRQTTGADVSLLVGECREGNTVGIPKTRTAGWCMGLHFWIFKCLGADKVRAHVSLVVRMTREESAFPISLWKLFGLSKCPACARLDSPLGTEHSGASAGNVCSLSFACTV